MPMLDARLGTSPLYPGARRAADARAGDIVRRMDFDTLFRDVRHALRLLRRSPTFAAVAILTLAFGIGVNTAIFSLADGMLFRDLPFRDPSRLVLIRGHDTKTGRAYSRVDRVDYEQIRAAHGGLADVALVENGTPLTWTGSDGAESIGVSIATPNLLEMLGVGAHVGRPLRPGDERLTPAPAMLTHAAWQRRFGGDAAVVGRTLTFDQRAIQIVGVLPPRFIYPLQGSLASGELLTAAAPDPADAANPRAGVWMPVARLKPGVSLPQAQAELDLLVRRAAQQFPETSPDRALSVTGLQYAMFELSRPLLWLLVGGAAGVLLIACANMAALLLARGAVRDREIAIRLAVGAGRGRIAAQLMVEAFVLGGLGGLAALLVGATAFELLSAQLPGVYRLVPERLDARAVLFTLFASIAATLAFGLLPALRHACGDLPSAVRGRRDVRPAGGLMKAGAPLVAAEVALALILFAGTALTANSLVRMRTVDLGFDPGGVVALSVGLPASRYPTPAARYEFVQQWLDSVRRMPGITAAGLIDYPQLGNAAPPRGLRQAGGVRVGLWTVTPGYFDALGLRVLQGRGLAEGDLDGRVRVAVVNRAAAAALWPGESALGQQITPDGEAPLTVVGVVGDVRPGYGRAAEAAAYKPLLRERFGMMSIIARTPDPAAARAGIRTAAQRLDPQLVVGRGASVDAMLDQTIASSRFETMLFALFGVLGLLVAAVGVYGLMASWVGARTREMGVRLALGADPPRLKRFVVRQACVPLAAGVVGGLAGAFALGRHLRSLLYEVTPQDPATLAAVVVAVTLLGLGAAYLPARRAARVDPVVTLRAE